MVRIEDIKNNPYKFINLELPILIDQEINGHKQKFALASVVYLFDPYSGQIIFIKQTKNNSSVKNNICGIGGKSKIFIDGHKTFSDKIPSKDVIFFNTVGSISFEDIKDLSVREIFEETGGLVIDKNGLKMIGITSDRLICSDKAESWYIYEFLYILNKAELDFLNTFSFKNNEGILFFMTPRDALQYMTPSDKTILKVGLNNPGSVIYTREIRDELSNTSILQTTIKMEDETIWMLTPDSNNPRDYYGIYEKSSLQTGFIYPAFNEFSLEDNKRKLEVLPR